MSLSYEFDTITAIATPQGTGGVGVIRLSGKNSFSIAKEIFSKEIQKGFINHGWIKDGAEMVDEVVILAFENPKSFTGEDVIEIQCHGGMSVLNNILELVISKGARIAEKGEFTKRAFLNGKLDLSQAEAVLDLIHAKTGKFAKKSANNLSGKLSAEIAAIKDEVQELLAKIVASIDFPEDVHEVEHAYIKEVLNRQIASIEKVLASGKSSNLLRQGVKVIIAGAPNAGKSSLFNAFLTFNRAIVTDIPGTTRDAISETIDIEGVSVTLIDTAGIREKHLTEKVEAIGIDYTKEFIENADLVLFLYDSSRGITPADRKILEEISEKPTLIIASKSDLAKTQEKQAIPVCVYDENSIKLLKTKIKQKLISEKEAESEYTTNQRQQDALQKAKEALSRALEETTQNQLQDLISIDIKSAIISLGEITGETINENILNSIFENFCIGK